MTKRLKPLDDHEQKVLAAMMPRPGDDYGSAAERGWREAWRLNGAPLCESAWGEMQARIIQSLAGAQNVAGQLPATKEHR